jgi:hypothetical protein
VFPGTTERRAVGTVERVQAITPPPRTAQPTDAGPIAPPAATAGPPFAASRLVAATACEVLGHRAFNADLPTAGQCCSRCFTLRGEDARRWSGS